MALTLALTLLVTTQTAVPVPTPRQLAWHGRKYYAFVHFGMNTFTNREWGEGHEDPNLFNPTQLDTDQWCETFKAAGMSGVILTAKHHDGFCLWPSKFSPQTVAKSPWMDGKGDVVRMLSDSCRKYGLGMGLYLSPWDRSHPNYGSEAYNDAYVGQLSELTTQYGPLFEVWWDGANGEGPNGKKQVYDFPRFTNVVRTNQPDACIFSDAGPDVRWVGNESGFAGETCWATVNGTRYTIGTPLYQELTTGQETGDAYRPAECDVSIRPGWFYHPDQDAKVRDKKNLAELWFSSVGRNGNLLLNVPADTKGRISEADCKALLEFKAWRDKAFARQQFWKQSKVDGAWVLSRVEPRTVDCMALGEDVRYGQVVRSFVVSAKEGRDWKEVFRGTTIGNSRIVRFPAVKTAGILLQVTTRPGTSAQIKVLQPHWVGAAD